jgi:hypothetical protein
MVRSVTQTSDTLVRSQMFAIYSLYKKHKVIHKSLRLLHTHGDLQNQRIKQLNQEIDIGLQQLYAGKKIPQMKVTTV